MKISLFNSLGRKKETFNPLEAGKVRMYHCGPTVYSSPHIGNFRAFLLADLLRRFLEDQGYQVTQVMNITDVGHMTADDEDAGADKMVEAARREKLDPWKIAEKYTDEFLTCLDQLHFLRPHQLPKATDFIKEMGEIIQSLLDKGYAYQVNGNVYFEISKFPAYGELSGKVIAELEEGARVAVNDEKRDPRDFALWKTDEKHLMQWDAPFKDGARGFPGWHIECSAMSRAYLGDSFDIHTGGEDNLFPHHECEVAQSECATGQPFVKTWLHVKHLMVDNKKMSKSLGNFYTVQEILEKGYSGLELRFSLMRVQYRQTMNFTLDGLVEARAAIKRGNEARRRLARIASGDEAAGADDLQTALAKSEQEFVSTLADDLNTSEALAAVFGLVSEVNKASPSKADAEAAGALFDRFERVLACFGELEEEGGVDAELQALLDQRQEARKAKDWAKADAMRDELQARGWKIVDGPEGSRLERI
ncbi:MAG: cysteine--tRNA ligase [Planctomycetota bacterium]|jgi:cysteinyl-tRNA synthetase